MKEHKITLPDDIVRGIRAGRISLLVEPMEPQPEQESIADYKFDLCYRGVFDYGSNGKNWLEFAPFAPGDVVTVREDRPMSQQGPGFQIRILTVEARLVGSITERECYAAGVPASTVCPGCEGKDEGCCVCDYTGRVRVGGGSLISAEQEFAADWARRHPAHPFERAWGWMIKFEIINEERIGT